MASGELIYGLIDSDTREMRYVGQTIHGMSRPQSHFKAKRRSMPVHRWIDSQTSEGRTPEVVVIEHRLPDDPRSLDELEVGWISYFRGLGCRLLNLTEGGGRNVRGLKWSEESRRRLSDVQKGRPSPRRGAVLSDEVRARISEGAKRGHARYWLGKTRSDETKRKISEARRGRSPSVETRAKLSDAAKADWQRRKG